MSDRDKAIDDAERLAQRLGHKVIVRGMSGEILGTGKVIATKVEGEPWLALVEVKFSEDPGDSIVVTEQHLEWA